MPHRSRKKSGVASGKLSRNEAEAKLTREEADAVAESRRGFLLLGGAAVVTGLVGACSTSTSVNEGTGGSSSTGGNGSGGSGSGGTSAAGGSSGSGGSSASGGSSGSGGSSARGGSSGSGGASASAGSSGNGGATLSGGESGSGGASARGGATGNGGRTGSGGATGDGGATGRGGNTGSGGVTGAGGTGAGGNTGTKPSTVEWPAEDTGGSCSVAAVPTVNNAKLPNPFKFFSGKTIATKEEWTCLRAELNAALQKGVYGPKMPPPDKLTATYSGGKINVSMTVGSNTQTFSISITGGGTEASPKPCLITCGGSSLGTISGVASINMSNNSFASESNLSGIIKNLYGNACAKSGALIGWAWGCSRIIDALELCPEAGINTKRLAVTGCSRNGKGALAMGAFDERVALTLPQEGGSGGAALWRVSTKEKSNGYNIQECGEITGEAKWQGSDFAGFCGNGSKIATLPCDQHYAVALCAPRAILVIENDIDWLGPVACYGGGVSGRKVFEALGIKDRCGVTLRGEHNHCQFPSNQKPDLDAFVNRFLFDKTADTDIDVFSAKKTSLGSFKEADWIDWEVPTLSGSLPFDPFG